MNFDISVIICTHNPQRVYLQRVLEALRKQTLPQEYWELLLIDNASKEVLSNEIDLSWHKNSNHLREENLGLTQARLCGIRASIAEIIVFVDDDNVLETDYLENALQIGKTCNFLGAWGGQAFPEFEEQPNKLFEPYLSTLALRSLEKDRWSNGSDYETIPNGAGMCIRKFVASKYVEYLVKDIERAKLDVTGKKLLRCGDIDLALTAIDLGLGTGVFTKLKLLHLIPSFRIQEDYLLKLARGNGYSLTILQHIRGKKYTLHESNWKEKILQLYFDRKLSPIERKFKYASIEGEKQAIREILANQIGFDL